MNPDYPGPSERASSTRDGDRPEIRQQLRRLRHQLDPATVSLHSHTIIANSQSLFGNARHIAGYLAFGNEVTVDDLMRQRRAQGQATYVPVIEPDHTLTFAPVTDSTAIVQNKYGIREPEMMGETCLPATSLDVVIVPLLGFDRQCNRMGMGGGYYDRTFAHKQQSAGETPSAIKPLLIGVAYELQCVDNVFPDWWDVPLDHVVTEKRIYSRNGSVEQAR